MKLKHSDVFTRKTFQGAWACSTIVRGQWVERQYFGWPKRTAVRRFIADVKKVEAEI